MRASSTLLPPLAVAFSFAFGFGCDETDTKKLGKDIGPAQKPDAHDGGTLDAEPSQPDAEPTADAGGYTDGPFLDIGPPADVGSAPDTGPAPDVGPPPDVGPTPDGGPVPDAGFDFDTDCLSCRADGQTCLFSVNCQPGSVCNLESDELFDPARPANVCIHVICQVDMDCDPGKVCGLTGLCETPICQLDSDCAGGNVCRAGVCGLPPSPNDAATCEVIPGHPVLSSTGGSRILTAIVRDLNGRPLSHIDLQWESNNTQVVWISGSTASGGMVAGSAEITVSVVGNPSVSCGPITLYNVLPKAASEIRVTVVSRKTAEPIAGADVLVDGQTGVTGANGTVTFVSGSPPNQVTAVASGHTTLTIFEPNSADLSLRLPAAPAPSAAGGFRGVVDLTAARRADFQQAFVGTVVRDDLDLGLERILCDPIDTLIDVPELGIDNRIRPVAGGLTYGLGIRQLTASAERCQGVLPGANELGCYLARGDGPQEALWAFGGELRLSEITSVVNAMLPDPYCSGDGLLSSFFFLVGRKMLHGMDPNLSMVEVPRVGGEPDYAQFTRADPVVEHDRSIHARVAVPTQPDLPGFGGCAEAVTILAATLLPNRGLIPLGINLGYETGNCLAEHPAGAPFGSEGPLLPPGEVPLWMSPPHSGLEGHPLILMAMAHDQELFGSLSTVRMKALVRRVSGVAENESFTGAGAYLDNPSGSVNVSSRTFTSNPVPTAHYVRLRMRDGSAAWEVVLPAQTPSVTLPALPGFALPAANMEADLQAVRIQAPTSYSDLWELGAEDTFDAFFETSAAFSTQECIGFSAATCRIQ